MRRSVLCALAAALMVVLAAAGPAQAAGRVAVKAAPNYPDCLHQFYPCWPITAVNYLANNPVEAMRTICLSGRLHLGAGKYDWGHVWRGDGYKLRQNFELGESDYTMATCLDPKDYIYEQTIWLDPDRAGWPTISVWTRIFLNDAGTYTWGAYLDPLF